MERKYNFIDNKVNVDAGVEESSSKYGLRVSEFGSYFNSALIVAQKTREKSAFKSTLNEESKFDNYKI